MKLKKDGKKITLTLSLDESAELSGICCLFLAGSTGTEMLMGIGSANWEALEDAVRQMPKSELAKELLLQIWALHQGHKLDPKKRRHIPKRLFKSHVLIGPG